MTLPNHPHDERLAALAGADADAVSDRELQAHVAACPHCRDVTADLTRLRSVLAELPDVEPPAHLPRFVLPPVPVEPAVRGAARRGGFLENLRRTLAPAMVAGAALALVGAVGTSGFLDPATRGDAVGGAQPAAAPELESDADGAEAGEPYDAGSTAAITAETEEALAGRTSGESGRAPGLEALWPTLIAAGVAIALGAFLLRRTLPQPSS